VLRRLAQGGNGGTNPVLNHGHPARPKRRNYNDPAANNSPTLCTSLNVTNLNFKK